MSTEESPRTDQEIWQAVTHCPTCDYVLGLDDPICPSCQESTSPVDRAGSPEALAELPRIERERNQRSTKMIAASGVAVLLGFHLLSLLYLQYSEKPDLDRAAAKGGDVTIATKGGRRTVEKAKVKRYAKLLPGAIARETTLVAVMIPVLVLAFFWPRVAAAVGPVLSLTVNVSYLILHPGQLGMLMDLAMLLVTFYVFVYLIAGVFALVTMFPTKMTDFN